MTELFTRMAARLRSEYWTATASGRLAASGASVGSGLKVYGKPIVSVAAESSLRLGDRVVLTSDSRFTALGVSRPVILRTLARGAELHIGDDVGISGGVICAAGLVHVGNGVLLGSEVMVFDTPFHPLAPAGRRYAPMPEWIRDDGVVIEDGAFVGARSTVLPGVRIGAGSVIGAGSTVTGDIPAGVLAAGNPCRVIREL